MMALIFLMYFIIGLQIAINKPYKGLKVIITLQLIFVLVVDVLLLSGHISRGILTLSF